MRNIALTFLGCFTILAACSNSDDAEKPVTPVPTGDVTIYATTSSLTRDLTRDAVNFSSKDNLAPTSITLNPTEQYQTPSLRKHSLTTKASDLAISVSLSAARTFH